jgi:hypothetical protein
MKFPWSRSSQPLEERVERLERGLRDLYTDWDDTYVKFRNLLAREAKKARRELQVPNGDGPEVDGLDPVSRQILRERGS